MVGYQPGYGVVKDEYPQDASGTYTRLRLLVMVAIKKNYALVAAAIGPYHQFSPELGGGHPSASTCNWPLDMGKYVNSFIWRELAALNTLGVIRPDKAGRGVELTYENPVHNCALCRDRDGRGHSTSHRRGDACRRGDRPHGDHQAWPRMSNCNRRGAAGDRVLHPESAVETGLQQRVAYARRTGILGCQAGHLVRPAGARLRAGRVQRG